MTTLSTIRTRCRNLLGDTAGTEFTDAQVNAWINDALQDLSNHFPQVKTKVFTTVADQRKYNWESDLPIAILSVEYPTGEDPPEYLQRRAYTDPGFWEENGYYDFITRSITDATYKPLLVISEEPEANDYIEITYQVAHDALSADADITTLPDRYLYLIELYVRWKAWQELATTEGIDPDPMQRTMASQLELNAFRAERSWYNALKDAKAAESET
ncbi:MAG: hypothetical protein AB1772_13460, partial [Candidatus Zixiibacteriota bacterium]